MPEKDITVAAFYSETFALWSLYKYLQDEEKYFKVFHQWFLEDVGKQQE